MKLMRSGLWYYVFALVVLALSDSVSEASRVQLVAPLATSTFDRNAEGWTTEFDALGAPMPNYSATGGFPGGTIFAKDTASGTQWYYSAPQKFLGNKTAAYGALLTFTMRDDFYKNSTNGIDVSMTGGGITLVYNTPINPATNWTAYNLRLNEAGGWRVNTLNGRTPTVAEMKKVLGGLTALRIRGDYVSGADTSYLDNVVLGNGNTKIVYYIRLPLVRR